MIPSHFILLTHNRDMENIIMIIDMVITLMINTIHSDNPSYDDTQRIECKQHNYMIIV